MTHDDAGTTSSGAGRRPASEGEPLAVQPGQGGSRAEPGPEGPRGSSGPDGSPGRATAILGALAAGVVAAVLGTLLHGQLVSVAGTQLQVGAVGALVLAGSLFLYCGLWSKNVIMTAVAGAVAYGVVAILSVSSKTLILTGASETAPAVAVAGNLWLYGVLVVTLGAVAVGGAVLRPRKRGHAGASGGR